jgi:hypothetical protein
MPVHSTIALPRERAARVQVNELLIRGVQSASQIAPQSGSSLGVHHAVVLLHDSSGQSWGSDLFGALRHQVAAYLISARIRSAAAVSAIAGLGTLLIPATAVGLPSPACSPSQSASSPTPTSAPLPGGTVPPVPIVVVARNFTKSPTPSASQPPVPVVGLPIVNVSKPTSTSGSRLPFTGVDVVLILEVGGGIVTMGTLVRVLGRRR